MKIFWWQLGLHFEPETPEESKALCLLFHNAHITSIAGPHCSGEGPSVPVNKVVEDLTCDQQITGCDSDRVTVFEQLANQ